NLAFGAWLKRLKAAALWHARLEDRADIQNSAQFRSWLTHEDNRAAWKRVAGVLHLLDRQREAPELREFRAAAWLRAHSTGSSTPKMFRFFVTGAAAVATIIIISTFVFWPAPKPIVYRTAVGQKQVIILADQSRVILDSSSSIIVTKYSRKSRALTLTKGRAHFDVVHDPNRPFSVQVGNERVVDIGTSFNVEKLNTKILVTLTQGSVKVEADRGEGEGYTQEFLLAVGQELTVNRHGDPAITRIDPDAANAWQRGQIVFNDESLAEAAERVNRYLATPLKIDPEIADTKISGVFNVRQLDAFVGAVTSSFPVQSKFEHGYIVLQKRV
ncbi:MAG: FecR family protein, partial [Limisphaerales bacterium]